MKTEIFTSMQAQLIAAPQDWRQILYTAARTCYSPKDAVDLSAQPADEQKAHSLLKKIFRSGHHSIFEHISFSFAIKGISRACSHQLVRHRIASFSQQSQRYVNYEQPQFILPPSIESQKKWQGEYEKTLHQLTELYKKLIEAGIPAEDARFVLPNATATTLVMTMNFRELMEVSRIRLCYRAQWEILALFQQIKQEMANFSPFLATFLQPKCVHDGRCTEMQPCTQKPFLKNR